MERTKWMVIALVALLAVPGAVMAAGQQKETIKVSGMKYSPAEVVVSKGVPVRLEFVVDEKPTCGKKVVFPELGIERELATGKATVVEFTPAKEGELTFTCGMKMMKGKVVVRAN